MYPEAIVKPMKAELTTAGFEELLSPEDVDKAIKTMELFQQLLTPCAVAQPELAGPGLKKAWKTAKNHLN